MGFYWHIILNKRGERTPDYIFIICSELYEKPIGFCVSFQYMSMKSRTGIPGIGWWNIIRTETWSRYGNVVPSFFKMIMWMLFTLELRYLLFWKINYNYSSFKSTCVCVSLVGLSSLFSGGRRRGHVRVWFRRLAICNIPLRVKTYNHYLYKVSSL